MPDTIDRPEGEQGTDTSDPASRPSKPAVTSRRRLVHLIGAGGLGWMAGCSDVLGRGDNGGSTTPSGTTPTTGGTNSDDTRTETDGELQESVTIGIPQNPFNRSDATTYNSALGYYTRALEPLVWVTKDLRVIPWLASDWSRPAERTWRFTLRDDITFQNGDPVTPERVATALNERLDKELINVDFLNIRPDGVKPVDDRTIEMTNVFATSNQPGYLSHMFAAIHHPDSSVTKEGNSPGDVIGTGPYRLEEVTIDQRATLRAYDDYWGGIPQTTGPHVKKLVVRPLLDNNTRKLALQGHRIDIGMELPASQYDAVKNADDTKVETITYAGTSSLYFNLLDEPTSDIDFRRAINYAVSQKKVVEGSQNGLGIPANGPVPPANSQSAHDSLPTYGPDKDKARSLVEESSYDGETITLLARQGEPPSSSLIGQIIRQDLKDVGVNIDVEIVGDPRWRDRRQAGEGHLFAATKMQTTGTVFSMINVWMSDVVISRGNPPATISQFAHTQPDARERLNAVIRHVSRSSGDRRRRLLVEAQRILMEDVVVILPLFHPEFLIGMRTGVSDADWNPIPRMSRLENLKYYK